MTTFLRRFACGMLLLATWAQAGAPSTADTVWTASWSAAPDAAGPALPPQSIRQIVRISSGGTSVRVRLSNLYGTAPLTVGQARVAMHANGSTIVPGTDHALLFGGRPGVTIAPGASVLSDGVGMAVAPLQALAISLYLPTPVAQATIHGAAMQTAYAARGADLTAAAVFPAGEVTRSRYFLTDVDVGGGPERRTLVVVGDSISDGIGSTGSGNRRWTDALAERLQAAPALATVAVSNAGIAGNRLLRDGNDVFVGPSMLARFERDALDKPGVRAIVLAAGINDISASVLLPAAPAEQASAQQIIDGMKSLIRRAHAKRIQVWGATLIPYAGTEDFYSAEGETKRQAVNAWIRSAHAFDAVVDFDRAVRDPVHPERLLAAYDSGDHLHPNDAGYQAMAAAVDLGKLATARKVAARSRRAAL